MKIIPFNTQQPVKRIVNTAVTSKNGYIPVLRTAKFDTAVFCGRYSRPEKKYDDKSQSYNKKLEELTKNGLDVYSAVSVAVLKNEQYQKALELVKSGAGAKLASTASKFDESEFKKAKELLSKGLSETTVIESAQLPDEQYKKVLILSDLNFNSYMIPKVATLPEDKFQRALELINDGINSVDIMYLLKLDDVQYQRSLELIKKGINFFKLDKITTLPGNLYQNAATLLQNNVTAQDVIDISEIETKTQNNCSSYTVSKTQAGLNPEYAYDVAFLYSALNNPEEKSIEEKTELSVTADRLQEVLHNPKIFSPDEQNLFHNLIKSIKYVITPAYVSEESIRQAAKGFFANNNKTAEKTIKETDFGKFGKTGIPLKYGRKEYINDLCNVLSGTGIEKRTKILNKTGITLTDDKKGYDGIIDLTKLDLTNEIENKVFCLSEKFLYENEITTGDKDTDNLLNSLIKGMPEFINIIGKKQHNTQNDTLDVHILKVLQEALNNPEYETLKPQEKTVLKFAIIMHDIAKKEGVLDKKHDINSALFANNILEKYPLPPEMKDRIFELIKNHHWLEKYDNLVLSAEEVAAMFRRINDFKLAKIMTEADLKGIGDNFYTEHKNALTTEKLRDIYESLDNIHEKGQLIFPSRIINPELIPQTEYKGKMYKVIDFTKLSSDFDLSKYGFEPDTKKSNTVLFMHAFENEAGFSAIKTLTDSSNDAFICASLISPDNAVIYGYRNFGFGMDCEIANIANASKYNQSSGRRKKYDDFVKIITGKFGSSRHRNDIPKTIKKRLNLNDEEYLELFKIISERKYKNQIKDDEIFKLGKKNISGKEVRKAVTNAVLNLLPDPNDDSNNELNLYKPKICSFIAKTDGINEIPDNYLNYVYENNLPIFILGNNNNKVKYKP